MARQSARATTKASRAPRRKPRWRYAVPEAQGGWRLPRASGALGWEPVSFGPMRICRYADGDGVAAGVVEGETVRPLRDTLNPTDVLAMSAAQRSSLSLGDPIALEAVRLLVPVQPRAVRDFVGFEQHVAAMVALDGLDRVPDAWYEAPAFYFSNPNALAATGDEIEVPPGCARFDFELEIAAVVGRRCPRPLSSGCPGCDRRLRRPQRLVGARSADLRPPPGDGLVQEQGQRHDARTVGRDR